MCGLRHVLDGVLHDFVAWAVIMLSCLWLASFTVGDFVGSVFVGISRSSSEEAEIPDRSGIHALN
jgi:hypothetical protein